MTAKTRLAKTRSMIWGILKDFESKCFYNIVTLSGPYKIRDYVAIFNWDLDHKKFWSDHTNAKFFSIT